MSWSQLSQCVVQRPEFHGFGFSLFSLPESQAHTTAAVLGTISYKIRAVVIEGKVTRDLLFAPSHGRRRCLPRIWLQSWELLTSQIDKVSYQKGSKLGPQHTNQYLLSL